MRILPTAPARAFQVLAAATVLLLTAGPIHAHPDDAGDALAKLLAERGSIETPMAPGVGAEAPAAGLLDRVQARTVDLTVAAMGLVGVRYRRGGTSADTGFDCSGFTRHVFEMTLGLALPRRADEQAAAPGLVAVKREDLRPGDLVFFNTLKRTFSHVGIYLGGNRFIHSPRPGQHVRTEDMSFDYWARRFTGARRVDTTARVERTSAPAPASPLPISGS
jgi:cell wall-associated NlpC family hydrolase